LLRKASDAEQIGWLMKDYQRGVTEKAAASGEPRPAPVYSGWVDNADPDTVERRKVRAGRIETAGLLHNTIALANDCADRLAKLRCCPTEEVLIREAIEKLVDAAREVEPRRGNERS
jgi:hypothetical protein